jgi:CubicO group peptidase (beta-lactamase class C family)
MKNRISKMFKGLMTLLACAVLCCAVPSPFSGNTDLDDAILKEMQARRIPSVTACVIKNDRVVWTGSYGLADKENGIPASNLTNYLLASLSKTVIATAVLQLEERGLIDIDQDIGLYLPFNVRNPRFPQSAITPRMLLTHSSGLTKPQTDDELPGFYDWFDPDSAPPLGQTMMEYLLPGGAHYVPAVWKDSAPGQGELYSNLGAALLAYLVEYVSGEDFSSYCRNHIFLPLNMPGTSYRISDLNAQLLAVRYMEDSGRIPHYTRRDYPAGQVKSSIEEFSHFLAAWMNDGVFNEARILNGETVNEALRLHNCASGICLIWNLMLGGWYGHSGGVNGSSTFMEFHREDKVGLIILSNIYLQSDNPIYHPAGKIYALIRNHANRFRS